jgi:carbon-monoxide dehydrogenase iron sulfur subunit
MKRIYIKEEFCIGCRLCEIHCLVQHSKSKKILKAFKEEFPRALPRVMFEEEGHLSFALPCRHCEDAPCLAACITGAMHRDPKHQVILCDEDRCVGCWMCIMVCPFGVIRRNLKEHRIASKCDLCYGTEVPVCVKNCPNEALLMEERPERGRI